MSHKKALAKYRAHLAGIEMPEGIDAACLDAVFYGATPGHEERVGTILSVRHTRGWGLFGPTTYTFVKLCDSCVHEKGTDCANPQHVEEELVVYVSAVRRNGDGPLPDVPLSMDSEGSK